MAPTHQPSALESPNKKALKRLLKNKPAIFGLIVIGFAIFIALFGYALAPDSTPDANEQIPEIAFADPGLEIQMLKVRKKQQAEKTSFLMHLWKGTPGNFKLIPIIDYEFQHDSLKVEIFRGLDDQGNYNKGTNEQLAFKDIDFQFGSKKDQSIKSLEELIEKEYLINKRFYLGTDKYGRDMLSRLILGVRISLLVGLIAVGISLTIGILLGAIAGYFGGRVDDFITLIINTVWSIPTLLLVFAIVLALGKGIGIIFLAVGLTMWVEVARIVRGQVMSLKEIQFVEAAQSMGFSHWRIISRHILPNILGPVMVVAAANFATAILVEAGLSYLGFGIQPPTPSWGTILNENYGLAIGGKPLLALVPAMAIMLMVLAFNLVGNGFRDALDVKGIGEIH